MKSSLSTPLPPARPSTLAGNEDGGATLWCIVWTIGLLALGGFSVDLANAWRTQSHLSVTADAAALAGAFALAKGEDPTAAALAIAELNMPAEHYCSVLRTEDVELLTYDRVADTITKGGPSPNAVRVVTRRETGTNNPLPTHLLGIIGRERFDVNATSTAMVRGGPPSCLNATIMTMNYLSAGGSNEFYDGVCLHGQTGVQFGGADFAEPNVRVTAPTDNLLDISDQRLREDSARRAQIVAEATRSPVINPRLNAMYTELRDVLSKGAYHDQADAADWLAVPQSALPDPTDHMGQYDWRKTQIEHKGFYQGDLLPSYLRDPANDAIGIVHVKLGWWTIEEADIDPYTVYVTDGGAQFAGNVDMQNGGILANGQIGVGGGSALHFKHVYFFGTGMLNFAGDVSWGDPLTYCDTLKYTTYLFSTNTVSLGGGVEGTWGVIAAAPTIAPGGAFQSSGGLYFEAMNRFELGGDASISGCGEALGTDIELGLETGAPAPAGAALIR